MCHEAHVPVVHVHVKDVHVKDVHVNIHFTCLFLLLTASGIEKNSGN
jgi:hypothetical protein